MWRLLRGGVYFTFPFPNAAFIGGRRLEEEVRYLSKSNIMLSLHSTRWFRGFWLANQNARMSELSRNKFQFKCIGIAVRLCGSFFDFLSISSLVLSSWPKIQRSLMLFLLGQIVFPALERCLPYLSCNLFLHKILFRLVRMVYLVAGSLLTSPPPLSSSRHTDGCENNFIKLNWIVSH